MIARALKKLLQIKQLFVRPSSLEQEVARLRNQLTAYEVGWPPGHFYSPIPALQNVKENEDKIWGELSKDLPGIDLNEKKQTELLHRLSAYYPQQPWTDDRQNHLRYYFNNPNYSYGESILFFCLLMHLKPQNVIEIGSGHSSCVLLDTSDVFLESSVSATFIEPYPQLLSSLLKPGDKVHIIEKKLEEVPSDIYSSLSAGDILFIDSTHVSKVGSDVNHIFFKVLPRLKSGVYIHFHDIYFPFEYPKEWIFQGRAWNEAYLLRAFLQYNDEFEIVLFNSFLGHFHRSLFETHMPLCTKNPGSSIWIRKR